MVTTAGMSESGCTPARDPLPMPLCSRMAVFIVRLKLAWLVIDVKSPLHSFTLKKAKQTAQAGALRSREVNIAAGGPFWVCLE